MTKITNYKPFFGNVVQIIPMGHEVRWQRERNDETKKRRNEEEKKEKKKNGTNGKYPYEAWYDG